MATTEHTQCGGLLWVHILPASGQAAQRQNAGSFTAFILHRRVGAGLQGSPETWLHGCKSTDLDVGNPGLVGSLDLR